MFFNIATSTKIFITEQKPVHKYFGILIFALEKKKICLNTTVDTTHKFTGNINLGNE